MWLSCPQGTTSPSPGSSPELKIGGFTHPSQISHITLTHRLAHMFGIDPAEEAFRRAQQARGPRPTTQPRRAPKAVPSPDVEEALQKSAEVTREARRKRRSRRKGRAVAGLASIPSPSVLATEPVHPTPPVPSTPSGAAPVGRAQQPKRDLEALGLEDFVQQIEGPEILEMGGPGLLVARAFRLLARLPGVRGRLERFLGRAIPPLTVKAPPLRRIISGAAGLAAGAAGELAIREVVRRARLENGGKAMPEVPRRALELAGEEGQLLDPAHTIIKAWDTAPGRGITGAGEFPVFVMLADGHIAVRRRDGRIKHYRPKKSIVIPPDPRLSQINKVVRIHQRLTKALRHFSKPRRRRG